MIAIAGTQHDTFALEQVALHHFESCDTPEGTEF